MIEILALAAALHQPASGPHTVAAGETLSSIAAAHGTTWQHLAAINPQLSNPNLIYAGNTVNTGGGGSSAAPVSSTGGGDSDEGGSSSPAASLAPVHHASSGGGGSSGSLSDIPGVPKDFAACVAFKESTNGTNQAYNGGVYGIINASGEHVNGQSIGAQKAAFSRLYAQYGKSPWSQYDGCR